MLIRRIYIDQSEGRELPGCDGCKGGVYGWQVVVAVVAAFGGVAVAADARGVAYMGRPCKYDLFM